MLSLISCKSGANVRGFLISATTASTISRFFLLLLFFFLYVFNTVQLCNNLSRIFLLPKMCSTHSTAASLRNTTSDTRLSVSHSGLSYTACAGKSATWHSSAKANLLAPTHAWPPGPQKTVSVVGLDRGQCLVVISFVVLMHRTSQNWKVFGFLFSSELPRAT